jgi:hypothetical protein
MAPCCSRPLFIFDADVLTRQKVLTSSSSRKQLLRAYAQSFILEKRRNKLKSLNRIAYYFSFLASVVALSLVASAAVVVSSP